MSLLLPTTSASLRLQAARRRDAGGLVFRDERVPFGALATAADEAGTWLVRRGIGAGDHVALLAGNHPALVAWQFAVWSIGAVAVPIGARSTGEELEALLRHARCRLVIADEPRAHVAKEIAAMVGIPAAASNSDLPLKPTALRRPAAIVAHAARAPRPKDIAVLAYTSGTTGSPKGAMLSHANLLWSALSCGAARGDRDDGVALCLSPLTHTPVFVSHLLCRLLAGQTAILLEKFDVADVLDSIARWRVTDVPLIAGMVFSLLEHPGLEPATLQCVRKVSVGGAATPMASKRRLSQLFAHAEIIEAYGQSESTDGVVMARGGAALDRDGTIGRPNPFVAVDVLRRDGSPADTDEIGEIAISGPTVMQGYYRDRAASRAAIRDGWLYSGDLGRRDADGYLYITGRAKDLIITGGENVSPTEVEEILRQHPGVADVAVVGTPHPRWGEQVTAAVVAATGVALDAAALIDFAATRLSAFKKPRRIAFLDRLPRNAANKVETARLKDILAEKD